MTKLKILRYLLIVCIIQCIYCTCPAKKTPNIYKLANYMNAWKKILICGKTGDVEGSIDSSGRWFLTTRVTVTENDNTESLCDCMKTFLLQSKWTKNTQAICLNECTSLTLLIIGIPDPDFVGKESVLETQEPIVSLVEVFGQYPNAPLGGGENCKSKSCTKKNGLQQVTFSCDSKNSNTTEACENIYNYINARNFLGETITKKCSFKNGRVKLNIIEKKDC